MFNWFKRPAYTEQTSATDDMMLGNYPGHVPPRPLPTPSLRPARRQKHAAALYSVGIAQDGRTQMFIGDVILTMSPDAVQRLIRQLESTLPDEDSE